MIIHSSHWALVRSLLTAGWLLLVVVPLAAAERRVLLVGDSISAAYGMSLEQGWAAQLAEVLAQQEYTVVNASISGETSAGGLRRLPGLLAEHRPALVIIELGGNDGLRGFPLARLRDNLIGMVTLAKEAGAQTLLIPMEIPPNYGTRYTDGFREVFSRVAQETDSAVTPFILLEVATRPELMQDDGIHPTAAAQPIMLETVLETILTTLAKLPVRATQ